MNKIWYYNYYEYLVEATSYFYGIIERIHKNNDLNDFFQDYEKEIITQFIFESNNLEKEGASEQETKKLVLENYNSFNDEPIFLGVKKIIFSNLKNIELLGIENIQKETFLKKCYVKLNNKNKKKNLLLVSNQLLAIFQSNVIINTFIIESLKDIVAYLKESNKEKLDYKNIYKSIDDRNYTPEIIRYFKREIKDNNFYGINEENIKLLHKSLSLGCKNNNNGSSGEYRPEGAYIDLNTVFMEPSLIKSSMSKFVDDHKIRYQSEKFNPFIEATKLSGDFVMIHPFGDFNGRLSRILVSIVLQEEGVPFLLVLRSNKTDKNKYITAMKRYYKGDPKPYLALICSVFINQVKQINEKFIMAGIEPFTPIELKEEEKILLKEEIDLLYKSTRSFR